MFSLHIGGKLGILEVTNEYSGKYFCMTIEAKSTAPHWEMNMILRRIKGIGASYHTIRATDASKIKYISVRLMERAVSYSADNFPLRSVVYFYVRSILEILEEDN